MKHCSRHAFLPKKWLPLIYWSSSEADAFPDRLPCGFRPLRLNQQFKQLSEVSGFCKPALFPSLDVIKVSTPAHISKTFFVIFMHNISTNLCTCFIWLCTDSIWLWTFYGYSDYLMHKVMRKSLFLAKKNLAENCRNGDYRENGEETMGLPGLKNHLKPKLIAKGAGKHVFDFFG